MTHNAQINIAVEETCVKIDCDVKLGKTFNHLKSSSFK